MPPKYVDHDQYRRELLHQCFELVAERGYSAITMRQLAAHLGVSMGTLYHYFKDKQALFEQLVEEIARQNAPPQDALIQLSETTREPTESLAALLSEVQQNKSHYLKQLFITADFHRLQASDTDHPSNVLQVAGEGYRQAITQVIGLSDPVMATLIRSMINGLVMEQMFGDNTVTFDEKAHLFVEMLRAYLNQEAEGTKPKG